MTVPPVGPPPPDPAQADASPGVSATKPASGDPKVRVKQIHPAVAKAMKHVLTPPVLTAAGLSLVGVVVLVGITLGWVAAVGFVVALFAAAFAGALAWKKAGVRKAAARQRQGDRNGKRPARRSLLDLLPGRRRKAARDGGHAGGGQAVASGPAAGSLGARGGLLGRLRNRFGRRPAGGGQPAHGMPSGGHGGGPSGRKGAHRAPGGLRGALARLGRKATGQGGNAPSGGGGGDRSGGHDRAAGGGGRRRGLRMPRLFRRKGSPGGGGHGPSGGGSPHTSAAGSGEHKPTRRGRRGGKNRNGSDSDATTRSPKKPGPWRRAGRDFLNEFRRAADKGKPRAKTSGRQQAQPAGRIRTCTKCGSTMRSWERAGDCCKRQQEAESNKAAARPASSQPQQQTRNEAFGGRPAQQATREPDGKQTIAPPGARHEGNTTMSGINHNSDASLFAYLRNLTSISPVIGETAAKVGATQTQVAALAEGIKKMAVHGDSEQPASKKLVASVEALGNKIAGYAQEIEDIIGKIRQAEHEAEALKAEADREHEMDLARREGGRGGLQREMRADVSRGIQDT